MGARRGAQLSGGKEGRRESRKDRIQLGVGVGVSGGRAQGLGKRGDCSQSLHTPTFITGWVVQVKGTGGIVQRWGPLHPGNRPACPPDLLLGS